MFSKMLVLALLVPGAGGCFFSSGRDHESRGRHEEHHDHGTVTVVAPAVHVHGSGCGHVFRAGIWVVGD